MLVQVAHLGENLTVCWHLSYQDVVPLESLAPHANKFVDVCNLVDDFVGVWNYCVKFFKGLQRLVVITKPLVDKTQVVNSFNAVCFHANGFKEELFGAVVVFVHKKTVSFVDESLGIVAVVLDGEVSELLCQFKIIFQKVEEGNVVARECHHNLVFLLEGLERFNSLLDLLGLNKLDGFLNLHFRFYFWQVSRFKGFAHVVVAKENICFDERSDKFCTGRHEAKRLLLFGLQVFF